MSFPIGGVPLRLISGRKQTGHYRRSSCAFNISMMDQSIQSIDTNLQQSQGPLESHQCVDMGHSDVYDHAHQGNLISV